MSDQTPPRAYQIEAAQFLAGRFNAILGDDAGLGKTRETIMAMDQLDLARRLVICPAVARLVWPAELARWSIEPGAIGVIHPSDCSRVTFVKGTRITIVVAYDTISSRRYRGIVAELARCRWDVVILDEGHRLANPGSNRTRAIYGNALDGVGGIIEHADRVWVLTGTPTPNHAGEAYTHARALFPSAIAVPDGTRLMEQYEFIERFCTYKDTPYGRQITGSKNQADLRHRMAPYVLRRRKEEVLTELPPLDFVSVPVPGLEVPPELTSWVPDDLVDDELLAFLECHTAQLATLRRRLGLAKIAACVEWCITALDDGIEKLVVFAHHRDVVTALRDALLEYSPVRVAGDTPDRDRERAIDLFQNDRETRVFVGQIDACGVAITLTAAHDVAFVECAWTPAANYQAASRCHRLGQRDGVLARMLYVPDSLDERIMSVFMRKAREVAELWD